MDMVTGDIQPDKIIKRGHNLICLRWAPAAGRKRAAVVNIAVFAQIFNNQIYGRKTEI